MSSPSTPLSLRLDLLPMLLAGTVLAACGGSATAAAPQASAPAATAAKPQASGAATAAKPQASGAAPAVAAATEPASPAREVVASPRPKAPRAAQKPKPRASTAPKAAEPQESPEPAAADATGESAPSKVPQGPSRPEKGLHLGVEVKGSMVTETLAFLVGPNLGWIVGDWKLGVSGFMVLNTVEPEQLSDQVGRRELGLWYGVGHVGYVLLAPYPIHFTPIVAAGVANVTVVRTEFGLGKYELAPVVEPALEIEFAPRPLPAVRAGVLASYRLLIVDDIDNVTASELSGPAVGVFVRFGSF